MPSKDPKVFNDSNDVVTALKQNQVDAVVTDLPTAFYITAAQVPGSKIAGQFDTGEGDNWGLLLAQGLEGHAVRGQGDRRPHRER